MTTETTRTMRVHWAPAAVEQALEHAKATRDAQPDEVDWDAPIRTNVTLTWQDVACLIDIAATAESLQAERDKLHGQMTRVHNALTWGEVDSEFVPPCGTDELMEKAGDIVQQLMTALKDARAERDEARADHLGACQHIAQMHAAAVGEVRGPIRGVVEDIEDVRVARDQALDVLRRREKEVTNLRRSQRDAHERHRTALIEALGPHATTPSQELITHIVEDVPDLVGKLAFSEQIRKSLAEQLRELHDYLGLPTGVTLPDVVTHAKNRIDKAHRDNESLARRLAVRFESETELREALKQRNREYGRASATIGQLRAALMRRSMEHQAQQVADRHAQITENARHLWSALDWTLWGHGLNDVTREPIATAMVAAIPAKEIERIVPTMLAWRARRGWPVLHEEYAKLRDQITQLRAERDRLDQVVETARDLFDNRLGWSDGRPPYAPRALWADLAAALYGADDHRAAELRADDYADETRHVPPSRARAQGDGGLGG